MLWDRLRKLLPPRRSGYARLEEAEMVCPICQAQKEQHPSILFPDPEMIEGTTTVRFRPVDDLFHVYTEWKCSNGHDWVTESTYPPPYNEEVGG